MFLAIGGAPLGFLYKAVNTMDSMLGYTDPPYRNIGFFPAKLDDVFNFLPARLSALLMLAAGALLGMDVKNGWRIFRRDRYCHASPNSAQTESACAGLLELRLAGDAWYHGVLHKKPHIGDPVREIEHGGHSPGLPSAVRHGGAGPGPLRRVQGPGNPSALRGDPHMLYQAENPHGGDLYGRVVALDFSVNTNPLGTPPAVRGAAAAAAAGRMDRYPDPFCRELTEAMARSEGRATGAHPVWEWGGGADLHLLRCPAAPAGPWSWPPPSPSTPPP